MKDWTVDPITRRSNSNTLFLAIKKEIENMIREESYALVAGRADVVAGLILAQLAHKYGFSPEDEEETWKAINGQ